LSFGRRRTVDHLISAITLETMDLEAVLSTDGSVAHGAGAGDVRGVLTTNLAADSVIANDHP